MERVVVILVTLALIAGMVGCPADPEPAPPVECSLTLSSSNGGQVTIPGEGVFTYEEGTVVSLAVEADKGYGFVSWTGDVGTLTNVNAASTTVTINGDYSITANFVAVYDLSISSTDGGSVTTPGEDTFTYDKGAVVNLLATRAIGYQFARWTGDVNTVADVGAAATTITMNGDYSITANFEEIPTTQYNLSISSTAGGSVTTPGEGTFIYGANSVVQLAAEALEGYQFAGWTGDVDTIANVNAASTTITMNGDYSIEATFEKVPEVFARDLVSWWRAEGDASDAWGDNHGVLMDGATFGEGKVGQGFRLDGVDDWVMVPSAPTLNFGTEDFTVCLWVNFTDPDPEQVMIEKYVETFGSPERIGWTFTKLDSTMVRLHLGPGHWSVVDAPANITANTWHFAAVSRSGNTYRVYWNGTLIGSASWEDNFNLDSNATLKIGHRGDPDDTPGSEDTSGYYLAGLVDEIQVFRAALSDEDILYLFNNPGFSLEPAA